MSSNKIAGMGDGHEDTRYGGKPPMVGNQGTSGHPTNEGKRAAGGSVVAAPGRKRGGKAPMHVAGTSSKHLRLDRRGRKSGGAVGADTNPMTTASRLRAPESSG